MLYLTNAGLVALFTLIGILLAFLGKKWQDYRTPFNDDEQIGEKSNAAVALRRAGFYLALALGIAGALFKTGEPLAARVQTLLADGVALVAILAIVGYVNDRFILGRIDNNGEIGEGNVAVGVVEFASYLAAGFILYASFTGEGGGVWSAVLFSLLGQVLLLAFFKVYDVLSPLDFIANVKKRNVAAGIFIGGKFIALGIILAASIIGPFTGWVSDITHFAFSAIVGFALLPVAQTLGDILLLPGTTVRREIEKDMNAAAVTVVESVSIMLAVIVAAAIL